MLGVWYWTPNILLAVICIFFNLSYILLVILNNAMDVLMQIKRGDRVIALGKLAIVREVFGSVSVKVSIKSTGEVLILQTKEVEFIDGARDDVDDESPGLQNFVTEFNEKSLEQAGRRYEVIKAWTRGDLTIGEAAQSLKVTRNHLYKVRRQFDQSLGSLSVITRKRGRKTGMLRLSDEVESVIYTATKNIYKSRAASYRKVWVEVQVTCDERKLPVPSQGAVSSRIKKILSAKERSTIKLGKDESDQRYAPRPGNKKINFPLQQVQMDHTLVDIILLADNRIDVIGRPWLTVVVDLYTRVLLGYYLSLHCPSAVSVACALTCSILPKTELVKSLNLSEDDYPFHGRPMVVHMDNASEFTSNKLKMGCNAFGIDPLYRPPGRKHYGGHVERLIGTFMTSKVHFLKGTTMSNSVARRGLDSEKKAVMTFSDFTSWFAREVVVYHSTVHSELKKSPKQAWFEYFTPNGGVYPPSVSDPQQLKLFFMPEKLRSISPRGINLHGQSYWDPVLAPHVGLANVVVKYDPFQRRNIWVKIDQEFYPIGLSDLTLSLGTYEEYRANLFFKEAVYPGKIIDDSGKRAYREKQGIETSSEKLTKSERRKFAAQAIYDQAYPEVVKAKTQESVSKIDYNKPPTRFNSEVDQ